MCAGRFYSVFQVALVEAHDELLRPQGGGILESGRHTIDSRGTKLAAGCSESNYFSACGECFRSVDCFHLSVMLVLFRLY